MASPGPNCRFRTCECCWAEPGPQRTKSKDANSQTQKPGKYNKGGANIVSAPLWTNNWQTQGGKAAAAEQIGKRLSLNMCTLGLSYFGHYATGGR